MGFRGYLTLVITWRPTASGSPLFPDRAKRTTEFSRQFLGPSVVLPGHFHWRATMACMSPTTRRTVLFAQLPIPPFGPTLIRGNVPLAAAYLKLFAQRNGLGDC